MEAPPTASAPLPKLEVLDRSDPQSFQPPVKKINDGPDVNHFLASKAYRDIGLFTMQLNRAMCPRWAPASEDAAAKPTPRIWSKWDPIPGSPVDKLGQLMTRIESFITEAPPNTGPRRFGNVSFRTWCGLLEERAPALMEEFLPGEVLSFPVAAGAGKAQDELTAYFLGGFGSAQRLDYGTGHELSFLAFLGCLWKLGAFAGMEQDGPVERGIVLGVIEPYLKVVRKLIQTYTLEPAGSHGVWGLDDHSFLPYIFGSAQLTRPITGAEAMPLEGSVKGAPRTGDVVKPEAVARNRDTNMYFSAIGFIYDVKKGPFWEHSPLLFDISGVRDGWGKINKGMLKMFNAEVLAKFPVVQHFPFGALFSWERDPEAAAPVQSVHVASQPGTAMPPPSNAGTAVPWAQATRMPGPGGPGIPYSRMPPPPGGTGALRMPPPGPGGGT